MLNPYLPPEILDYIVDLLHDNPNALKECCLVSKSWTPRTRKHIFANVELYTEEDLESWKELFPDPSTSPSRYTNTLHVGCPYAVTPADAEAGGWIRGFSRVMNLELDTSHDRFTDELGILLVPFHGLSPVIKSLRVDFVILPPSCIFNLILSFPLLEDLILIGDNTPVDNGGGLDGLVTAVQPSKQPALTGSLELLLHGGTVSIAHRLLSLPGGIHFQKLELVGCREKDLSLVTALVEKCSYTLEYLDITCWIPAKPGPPGPVDLSKVTALKDITFRLASLSVEWIATTLRTITPKHRGLRQISIYLSHRETTAGPSRQAVGEVICGQWLDLDQLLVQSWESRSIRPRVIWTPTKGTQGTSSFVGFLLPEATRRGIVDLA